MWSRNAPPTWRLLRLSWAAGRHCATCGHRHEFLVRATLAGPCRPVLFPPGIAAPRGVGDEVETFVSGLDPTTTAGAEDPRYEEAARRVREAAIRCERCGERFEDLDVYRRHPCELRYR